jgi:protein MAK16
MVALNGYSNSCSRLVQVAIRTRRIAAEEARLGEKLVPKLAPKIKHREAARERKAEVAAKLERTIERELLGRLRQGAYGDQPLNVSESIWKKVSLACFLTDIFGANIATRY